MKLKKFLNKRLWSLGLAGALTAAMILPVGAATTQQNLSVTTGIGVQMDGLNLRMTDVTGKEVGGIYYDGTTYVPARALGEALGQNVSWDSATSSVIMKTVGNEASNDAAYLKEYFGIAPMTGTVSWSTWSAALNKVNGSSASGSGTLTPASAAKSLVALANLTELAENYKAETAAATCKRYGTVSAADAKYVACALDTGLIPTTVNLTAALDGNTASALLMNAVETAGLGRNYIGYSSDADIGARLVSTWNSFTLFDDQTLSDLGVQVVTSGATTGYNLKYDGYSARFLKENTIQYGHSDITHAVQLMGLLNREGLVAKVQLEPKVSVYQYLLEWSDGVLPASTPTYEVRKASDDLYLCYAVEYDLMLEFASTADRDAFDKVIMENAKKSDDAPNGEGMIYGAWWQPLYSTKVAMPAPAYQQINDVVVRDGSYTIHPFATNEKLPIVKAAVQKINPSLTLEPTQIWVNAAFYRYLTGSDYQ